MNTNSYYTVCNFNYVLILILLVKFFLRKQALNQNFHYLTKVKLYLTKVKAHLTNVPYLTKVNVYIHRTKTLSIWNINMYQFR